MITRGARLYWIVATILLALLAGGLIYNFTRVPQSNRDWSEEFSKTTTATTSPSGLITFTNVRDWTYASSTVLSKNWDTVTIDPKTITRTWFIMEPFQWDGTIAHTLLTFEFQNGMALSFSVEARTLSGKTFSGFDGLFNTAELAYTWGTERDFVGRRVLYLGHTVYRYPLNSTPAQSTALFTQLVVDTNTLATHPRFYNTLTENCTDILAYMVNGLRPHTLPVDLSWFVTGFSDEYLMKEKFISRVGGTDTSTRAFYDLTPYKSQILSAATSSPQAFSALLDSFSRDQ